MCTVKAVEFDFFSAEQIERLGVEVNTSNLYDGGLPCANGVLDTRLGAAGRTDCGICYHGVQDCPGHLGFIRLTRPVYHPLCIDVVLKIVRCVCFWCAEVLVPDFKIPTDHQKHLSLLSQSCKNKKQCPHCEGVQPKFSKSGYFLRTTWPPQKDGDEARDEAMRALMESPYTTERALLTLTHLSDSTLAALGFTKEAHPKDLILQNLPVIPASVRPVFIKGKQIGHVDLTHQSQVIVKVNNQLKEKPDSKVLIEQLSNTIWGLLYKDTNPKTKNGGVRNPVKSLSDRIAGKGERLRGNVVAKRCNGTSRAVIGPDPNHDVDCIGLPQKIALNQTKSVRVNRYNAEAMKTMVRKGPAVLGGAKAVVRGDGRVVVLQSAEHGASVAERLAVGDVVERYLRDGDFVAMNRQPSLHVGSFMGHRVRIVQGNTIKLNLACCKSYNADFDGDEMNVHVPETLEARAELETIMAVESHIVSAGTNRPVIALCQDSIVSAYKLTRKDTFLTKPQLFQLAMTVHYADRPLVFPPPAILRPKELWTGKQAIEYLLPRQLNLEQNGVPNGVLVRKGVLLKGRLCKRTLGAVENGLVHVCCRYVSNTRCIRMISDLQRLLCAFLGVVGYSIGVGDCLLSDATQQTIEDQLGAIVRRSARPGKDPFEVLSKAMQITGSTAFKSVRERDNAFVETVNSGAKGSEVNFAQCVGCVSQQAVNGQAVRDSLPNRAIERLAEVPPLVAAEAQGFVENSYATGLTPYESFTHAMSGRIGIIDTACKTATTGYLERKLAKFMESIVAVGFDGSARDENGNVIQFLYGADGYEASKLETVGLNGGKARLPVSAQRLWDTRDHWEGKAGGARDRVGDARVVAHLEEALNRKSFPRAYLDAVVKMIEAAKVQDGESVGMVGATSIGEPATQLTLNSFHHCGVGKKNVTGIPRLLELVNLTPAATPSMTVPLSGAVPPHKVARALSYATVGDVVVSHEQVGSSDGEEEGLARAVGEAVPPGPVLVLRLDRALMEARGIEPRQVGEVFQDSGHVLFSEALMPEWCVKIRRFGDSSWLPERLGVVLQGLSKRVTGATPRLGDPGTLETEGSDLKMALTMPGVDGARTTTNDVHEIYRLLGIEAARRLLREHIEGVLTFDGNYINTRHISLLVDTMCHPGWLKAVSRHGLAKDAQVGILKRASFETPLTVFRDACIANKVDRMVDVTANVFFGNPPPVGTGTVHFTPSPALAPPPLLAPPVVARAPAVRKELGPTRRWDFRTNPRDRIEWEVDEREEGGLDDEEDIYGPLPQTGPPFMVNRSTFDYDQDDEATGFVPDSPPHNPFFFPDTPPVSPPGSPLGCCPESPDYDPY